LLLALVPVCQNVHTHTHTHTQKYSPYGGLTIKDGLGGVEGRFRVNKSKNPQSNKRKTWSAQGKNGTKQRGEKNWNQKKKKKRKKIRLLTCLNSIYLPCL